MKKQTKWGVLVLALILVLGALSVIAPSHESVQPIGCNHKRVHALETSVTGDVRTTSYTCDDCGAELEKETDIERFEDHQPYKGTADKLTFSGNWSVGWVPKDGVKFTAYNSLGGDGNWATTDGAVWELNGYGGYRIDENAYLGVSYESQRYPAICYTASEKAVFELDFSRFYMHVDDGNPFYMIYKNSIPLFADWQVLGTGAWANITSARLTVRDMRIDVVPGDRILFVVRPNRSSVDQLCALPILKEVPTDWTVMRCDDGEHLFNSAKKCDLCGAAQNDLRVNVDPNLSYYEHYFYIEGMTWREMQESSFANDNTEFGCWISGTMENVIIHSRTNGNVYYLCKDGKSVSPDQIIDKNGNYTFEEM